MTPEKRKKIKALMESPAASANEKEICRQLLKDNPETQPVLRDYSPEKLKTWQTPRSQAAGRFWGFASQAGKTQDAARRQRQAAQSQASSLDDRHRQAQRAANSFMEELAKILRDDARKGKK